MAVGNAILIWSEVEPSIGVYSADELDNALDEVAATCSRDIPIVVTIDMHGYEVGIGLGLPQSFVHIERENGEPPYQITCGEVDSRGVVAFFLHGHHHTEIERRNLIPIKIARQVVREFFESGRLSKDVNWTEV